MNFWAFLHDQHKHVLRWTELIVPFCLFIIYSYLSYLAFFDHTFFFSSMAMPYPNHDFLIWSWAGKNSAIVIGLLLSILSRRNLPLIIMMAVLLTMQLGDIYAGAKTGVNVFVTYMALSLVALTILLRLRAYKTFIRNQ